MLLVLACWLLVCLASSSLISCGDIGYGGDDDGDVGPSFIAPAVSQVTPEANSTNIPTMTIVGVELNDVVDAKTITQGTLSVVSATLQYSAQT
jgi:hypothetical protein